MQFVVQYPESSDSQNPQELPYSFEQSLHVVGSRKVSALSRFWHVELLKLTGDSNLLLRCVPRERIQRAKIVNPSDIKMSLKNFQ